MASSDPRLEAWLEALVATPGMTGLTDLEEARRVHVEEVAFAAELLTRGRAIDVGSGGGSPGIPLAIARPDISFVLLDSSKKKCAFLERQTRELPNVEVVCSRVESFAVSRGRDRFQTALARSLAVPPTAIEWCLPLVAPGGVAVLFIGDADVHRLQAVAEKLGGGVLDWREDPAVKHRQLAVVPKLRPTPAGYPRPVGRARKRPLA